MATDQQGDVLLFQSLDDGDIIVNNGIVEMNGGLQTAAYLSLFGGNELDNGQDENTNNWWANLEENSSVLRYRSETQNLLRGIPATSNNLIRIEDAVKRDLDWFLSENIASSVEVEVTIPAVNTVKIVISIEAQGEESDFEFVENWSAN